MSYRLSESEIILRGRHNRQVRYWSLQNRKSTVEIITMRGKWNYRKRPMKYYWSALLAYLFVSRICVAGLCFCFFCSCFIFSLPLRSDRGRFSRLLFFSSLSLLLFVFFGCSDGMEREACVCDHGFERSDLCAEIIITQNSTSRLTREWNG